MRQPTALLWERDLQAAFLKIMEALPDNPGIKMALLDTHLGNKGTLGSSPFKPGAAMYLKDKQPVPLTTLGFLELKRTAVMDDAESIGQAVSYGETLLELLSPGMGRQALVGVTDLRTIQWVLVTRQGSGFKYQVADKQPDARASLFAVLCHGWATAGLQLPSFIYDAGPLEPVKMLGYIWQQRHRVRVQFQQPGTYHVLAASCQQSQAQWACLSAHARPWLGCGKAAQPALPLAARDG